MLVLSLLYSPPPMNEPSEIPTHMDLQLHAHNQIRTPSNTHTKNHNAKPKHQPTSFDSLARQKRKRHSDTYRKKKGEEKDTSNVII